MLLYISYDVWLNSVYNAIGGQLKGASDPRETTETNSHVPFPSRRTELTFSENSSSKLADIL